MKYVPIYVPIFVAVVIFLASAVFNKPHKKEDTKTSRKEVVIKNDIPKDKDVDENLPETFSSFRVMVEITPKENMSEKEIVDSINDLTTLIQSSDSCAGIKTLIIAGACEENGKVVYRVILADESTKTE